MSQFPATITSNIAAQRTICSQMWLSASMTLNIIIIICIINARLIARIRFIIGFIGELDLYRKFVFRPFVT